MPPGSASGCAAGATILALHSVVAPRPRTTESPRGRSRGRRMLRARLSFLNAVRRKLSGESTIVQHIKERGGRVVRIRRTPFAEAWFGQTDGAVFDVTYRDPRGVEHQTTCKVSISGALGWLDSARDPRNVQRVALPTPQNGLLNMLACPYCHAPVYRDARRCGTCRVPFVGT